jgi:hypothetical protein
MVHLGEAAYPLTRPCNRLNPHRRAGLDDTGTLVFMPGSCGSTRTGALVSTNILTFVDFYATGARFLQIIWETAPSARISRHGRTLHHDSQRAHP